MRKSNLTQGHLKKSEKGFTMIEMLIVLAIGIILVTFSFLSLRGLRGEQILDDETATIVAVLRSAQEKSFNQENSSRWGVYFVNNASPTPDYYSLFQVDEALIAAYTADSSIIPAQQVIGRQTVSTSLNFQTPAVGANVAVMFSKITGKPDVAQDIILSPTSGGSSVTIFVNSSGRIVY